VGALGAWTSHEDHQPRARDDLSGPLPFGQSDYDHPTDIFYITVGGDGHMSDHGLKRSLLCQLVVRLPTLSEFLA
jgi:hypothetical protein